MLPKRVYSVILLFLVVKGEEPHCSKFDFEEKVLEKMVRMEFEMERIKLEMQRATENDQKMNTLIHDQMGLNFKEKLSDEIKKEFRVELENVKEVLRTPTVAFKARSNANINVQDGKTFVFPVIIMNVGNGYDSTSGVFTAPVNGTYLFTTAFCVNSPINLVFAIMVDGKQQSVTTYYVAAGNSCHSADSNAVLTAGQKVWVQVLPGGNNGDIIIHQDAYRWNMFSGTLVNA